MGNAERLEKISKNKTDLPTPFNTNMRNHECPQSCCTTLSSCQSNVIANHLFLWRTHARTLDASMTSTSSDGLEAHGVDALVEFAKERSSEGAIQISASLMKSPPTESVPASSPVTCVCNCTGHRLSTMVVVGATVRLYHLGQKRIRTRMSYLAGEK